METTLNDSIETINSLDTILDGKDSSTILESIDSLSTNNNNHLSFDKNLVLYCVCRKSDDGIMINCDSCDEWYHIKCVNMKKKVAETLEQYCCIKCQAKIFLNNSLNICSSIGKITFESYQKFLNQDSSLELSLFNFFSTVKGKHAIIWINEACAQILHPSIINLINNPVYNCSLFSSFLALDNQVDKYQLQDIPAIVKYRALMRQIPAMIELLAVLSSQISRPTLSKMEQLATALKLFMNDTHAVSLFVNNSVKNCKEWMAKFKSMSKPSSNTSLDQFKRHLSDAQGIIIDVHEMCEKLSNIVEDRARRHCACSGFNDGSFMIKCSGCCNWFHGKCVWLTEELFDNSKADYFECPSCCNEKHHAYVFQPINETSLFNCKLPSTSQKKKMKGKEMEEEEMEEEDCFGFVEERIDDLFRV